LERFSEPTRQWFASSFAAPTEAQVGGWEAIAAGEHTLIHAPTGSGKTLSAFLWAIDRLAAEPPPPERERCRVLYVSPMKALAYDIERNLRAPLTGIQHAAQRLGLEPPRISTAMRTGDTPARDRQAMLRHPPDMLITTPESLYLMLTSRAREILRPVRWVIIDEIHSVASTKRGSHLSLSLERLTDVTDQPPQRIGLSATQRPLERIAEFLGGGEIDENGWTPRPVTVVDAPRDKTLEVEIVVPVEDMTRPESTPPDPGAPAAAPTDDPVRKSIWPAVYPQLLKLILDHRSTLLFVNSRGLAERLASQLNELAGEELVQSHHGSVSREQRIEIESRLKAGELRGVVATSTLELGIDIAAIDLVVLVESPSSVARGLQRVGRAGHQVGAASKAKVFPKHRGDLLETAVVVDRMLDGAIEETVIPRHPLDVLAQQVVASVAVDDQNVDELFATLRRAEPYRDLSRGAFDAVLDMLAGKYPSDEFAELRPRIIWDRVEGTISPRGNARMLAVTNAGTIPDRGLYRVTLPEGGKVGELDEEMVYESRVGDVFVLGSTAWKIAEIGHDRVEVLPAGTGATAKMPFWHGDRLGRPLELGRAVGEFIRTVGALDPDEARTVLRERYRLDAWAADNLAAFIADEKEATGTLPTDRTIVVEQFRDEIGDWRTVVLSPFGGRVHAPWALSARRRYRDRLGIEADVIWSDDGIVLRFPDVDEPPPVDELLLDPDELSDTILDEVADSALFTSRFRESAARALLLPRRRPGSRTPLWLQRRRAASLLGVAKRYGSFPIVLETYREVLQDYFDLPALEEILRGIRSRTIRVHTAEVSSPSPFASSLLFDFIASFMYEYDAPIAEKRAAALTLDRGLLQELLGDPEFRDLLDADVIAVVELELQRLAEDRHVAGLDQTADLLRHLGPLTTDQVFARSSEPPDTVSGHLTDLRDQRRIVEVRVAGAVCWAAVEDVARLRDALGVSPPQGIPQALLEPVADPLGDVVGRYARTHAPFTTTDAALGLGLPDAVVAEVLGRLEAAGRVASGSYRPGGTDREWVDTEVLRRLKRRSLAVLRDEVAAVEPEALGRFLPHWHGIGDSSSRPGRLLDVVRRMQGIALPASVLEPDILSARMDYAPSMLDDLLASGEVVWTGREPLGRGDGRVALYVRDQVPLLWWEPSVEPPAGTIHDRLRSHLAERGASFWRDLYAAAEGGDPQTVLEGLWDLVWAGEVTNDTMVPLRAYLGKKRGRSNRSRTVTRTTPPAASGRWYLVADLLPAIPPSPEEIAKARAEQLLERHGIVTRDAVLAEGSPGGFAGLYPVFGAMEDTGRVRRGYFIEGLGGAQFATPGAVDRLRLTDETGVLVLAATDPANPFGATAPWPSDRFGARRAGAFVVLHDGSLAAYVERGGRSITTNPEVDPAITAAGLAIVARTSMPRISIETIDGDPAATASLLPHLTAEGFTPSYKGLTYRPARTARV
ncbi:MAG: DEAD/DEAH box helicase, partial [Acidimicrobiia bacterium]|nr:DEAD/DEAH box helicase [Acidimicrobiia bacterium]